MLLEQYLFVMRVCNLVALPINLFVLFCMVYKTPKIMLYYKPTLIYHQIVITLLEIWISELGTPVFFFPKIQGFSEGLIAPYFRPRIPVGGMSLLILLTVASGIQLLFLRQQTMLTPGSKLQLSNSSKHLFFLFLHLFAVIPPPLAMYIVAEWNDPKKMISDMNSLVLDVFEKEPLRVYAFAHDDIGPKVVVCAYVLTATTFVSLSGTLVFLTINGTRRFTKSFSASTKKSQREFMITTSVHYTVFIMFLYGGLGVLISPLITGIIDQRTNYYGLIIIAMNSIVSAPIQIFACKAYREFTMKFFKPVLRLFWKTGRIEAEPLDETNSKIYMQIEKKLEA